jgi:hypothetical protein
MKRKQKGNGRLNVREKTVPCSLRLPISLAEWYSERAREMGASTAQELMRQALHTFMNQQELEETKKNW